MVAYILGTKDPKVLRSNNKIYIKNDDLAIFESKEKIDEFVSAIINNFYSKLLKKLSTESINTDTLNTNVLDTNYPSDSIT